LISYKKASGLEHLSKLYDRGTNDHFKQIIIDAATELLLGSAEIKEKPGDLMYNNVYHPNLVDIFTKRDNGPWKDLIEDFDQKFGSLSRKLLTHHPGNKQLEYNLNLLRQKL
jgi:hypothetical protein